MNSIKLDGIERTICKDPDITECHRFGIMKYPNAHDDESVYGFTLHFELQDDTLNGRQEAAEAIISVKNDYDASIEHEIGFDCRYIEFYDFVYADELPDEFAHYNWANPEGI